MKKWMFFAALVGIFGCADTSDPTQVFEPPKVEDYNQTCRVNFDCEIISKDPCECGSCSEALNKDALTAFVTAANKVECSPTGDCATCTNEPACVQGKCTSREIFNVEAAAFMTNCQTVADCRLIAEGEICQFCACGKIAVNADDYAQKVPTPECGNANVACNNCLEPELGCVDNICVAVDPL